MNSTTLSILFVGYTDAERCELNHLLYTAGSFQQRVWISLAKNIGPGKVVSYGDLAKMVNSPGLSHHFINFS
jgi:O6-methylguanine-DNA--protein-cysteine methyltransferase